MSGTAGDVIRVAKAEVGYHEAYSGGHWNNYQKYSPAVPGLEWSQNQAWCATFVAWCFQEAGMPKGSYPVTASCAIGVAWWRNAGRFSEYPAIGAQVFFGPGGGSHTGLVYAYDSDFIYTVEGNTNSSGSAEGDGVYLKKRARRDSYVYGYGYPAYSGGLVTADPTWKAPASTTTQEAAPMAINDTDAKRIAEAVLSYQVDDPRTAGAQYVTLKHLLWWIGADSAQANATVRAQAVVIDQLVKTVAQLTSGVSDLDPGAIVTELKAAIESVTVHLDVPNS